MQEILDSSGIVLEFVIEREEEPIQMDGITYPEGSFRDRLEQLAVAYDNGHRDSRSFYLRLLDLAELHDKKQADYGRDSDPFANVRRAHNLGVLPSLGVILRMGDKFGRLESFAVKGTLQNESVEDSLRDIAVYALIGLVLLQNGE